MSPASYFTSDRVQNAVAVPAMVSLCFLGRLWWKGELYGAQLRVFVLWFLVALATQLGGPSVWWWLAGFLGQVALALVLVLKHQWTDIF
jgi:hypothetical protein